MSRAEEILDLVAKGDYKGISLEEYMQVSFLALMSGDESHIEEKIIYGGNLFNFHACVHQVNPAQQVKDLRNVV